MLKNDNDLTNRKDECQLSNITTQYYGNTMEITTLISDSRSNRVSPYVAYELSYDTILVQITRRHLSTHYIDKLAYSIEDKIQ